MNPLFTMVYTKWRISFVAQYIKQQMETFSLTNAIFNDMGQRFLPNVLHKDISFLLYYAIIHCNHRNNIDSPPL